MTGEIAEELMNDRHRLDAVARAVVSGERGLGESEDAMADDVASLMINRLDAARASGYSRVAHLDRNAPGRQKVVEERYGREFLRVLIRRTDKHLAHQAMLALTDADP